MAFFLFCYAGAQENRILELEFMICAVGNTAAADTRYRNSDQGSERQGFNVGRQGWNEGEEHPSGRRRSRYRLQDRWQRRDATEIGIRKEGVWFGYLGTVKRKGRIRQAKPTATAPHLYSTDSGRSGRTENVGKT